LLYLTTQEVIEMHDSEIPEAPLSRRDLLDSAVMSPRQSAGGQDAYPTIHLKAAALMRGVAANHAFVDGNKRTALLATFAFYGLNGWLLEAPDAELIHLLVDIVVDHIEVPKIAEYLEQWASPIPDPEWIYDNEEGGETQ